MARRCARICGIKDDEIVATQVGPDGTTLSMTVARKVSLFTRFLGSRQEGIAANSTATVYAVPVENGPKTHSLRVPCSSNSQYMRA